MRYNEKRGSRKQTSNKHFGHLRTLGFFSLQIRLVNYYLLFAQVIYAYGAVIVRIITKTTGMKHQKRSESCRFVEKINSKSTLGIILFAGDTKKRHQKISRTFARFYSLHMEFISTIDAVVNERNGQHIDFDQHFQFSTFIAVQMLLHTENNSVVNKSVICCTNFLPNQDPLLQKESKIDTTD